MLTCQLKAATIALGQQFCFAVVAPVPNRPDSMNDEFRFEVVALSYLGIAGRTAIKCATLLEQSRSGGTVNGTVDPTTAEQTGIGSIDNGINVKIDDRTVV